MRREGTYRVAIASALILLAALILGFTSPLILDAGMPVLQTAAEPERCAVVVQGCHGERSAIHERWVGLYDLVYNRGACTQELRPIDAVNYSAGWEAGRCQIEATMPDDCEQEFGPDMCTAISDVIDTTYGD